MFTDSNKLLGNGAEFLNKSLQELIFEDLSKLVPERLTDK